MKGYTFDEAMSVGKEASRAVGKYLDSLGCNIKVINVEENKEIQGIDIDILWIFFNKKGIPIMRKIEVKGDRHTTGNFFFETISNKSKNTPGCFLYTEADYLFYFFVKTHELYILPMPETRHWFLSNIRRFKTSGTTSLVNNDYYQSEGKLVPIDTVMKEVEGAKVVVI